MLLVSSFFKLAKCSYTPCYITLALECYTVVTNIICLAIYRKESKYPNHWYSLLLLLKFLKGSLQRTLSPKTIIFLLKSFINFLTFFLTTTFTTKLYVLYFFFSNPKCYSVFQICFFCTFCSGWKLMSVYCSLSHLKPVKLFKSENPGFCNLLFPTRAPCDTEQITTCRFPFDVDLFLFQFDVLFYALIRWETQGVKLHFRWENTSLSQGSPLFKLLHGKAIRKPTMGEWICLVAAGGLEGKAHPSRQTALGILLPARRWEWS